MKMLFKKRGLVALTLCLSGITGMAQIYKLELQTETSAPEYITFQLTSVALYDGPNESDRISTTNTVTGTRPTYFKFSGNLIADFPGVENDQTVPYTLAINPAPYCGGGVAPIGIDDLLRAPNNGYHLIARFGVSRQPQVDGFGTFPEQNCVGDNINISLSNAVGGSQYTWYLRHARYSYFDTVTTTTNSLNYALDEDFVEALYEARDRNAPPGDDPYSDSYGFYFHVTVRGCGTGLSGTSVPTWGGMSSRFRIYPAPPDIDSVYSTRPTCPGGSGFAAVRHSIAGGYRYVYIINQYVPRLEGELCRAGTETILHNGKYYCEGNIANAENINGTQNFTLHSGNLKDTADAHFDLIPGLYALKIETYGLDLPGCIQEDTFVIEEALPLVVNLVGGSLASPACTGGNDGSASFTIVNGRAGYSWRLYDDDDALVKTSPSSFGTRTFEVPDIEAGTYYVVASDGCTMDAISADFQITDPGTPLAFESSNLVSPTCYDEGEGNGEVDLVITPPHPDYTGISEYTYEFYNAASASPGNLAYTLSNAPSSLSLDTLGYGVYTVKAISPNGCEATENVNFTLPARPNGTAVAFGATCSGTSTGGITFTKSAGANDLKFYIDDILVPASQVSTTDYETYVINGYPAGTVKFTVQDCCLVSSPVVPFREFNNRIITEPATFAFNTTLTNFTNGQTFNLDCSGEVKSITIAYQGGGLINTLADYGYQILITDGEGTTLPGFDYLNKGTATTHTANFGEGTYHVTVYDDCGQSIQRSFTVNVPELLSMTIDSVGAYENGFDITCYNEPDGSFQVRIANGTTISTGQKNYTVSLTRNGSSISATPVNCIGNNDRDCFRFENLMAGTYVVTAADRNSCDSTFNNLPIVLDQPQELVLTTPGTTHFTTGSVHLRSGNLYLQCNGDETNFVPAFVGGSPPYKLTLSKWNGSVYIEQEDITVSISGDATFSDLGAGSYQLEIVDQVGHTTPQQCAKNLIFTLNERAPLNVLLQDSIYTNGANARCYGEDNGEITATLIGGFSPYDFVLNSSNGGNSATPRNNETSLVQVYSGRVVGTSTKHYTVTVTDDLGCQATDNISLSPPALVTFDKEVISRTINGFDIPFKGDSAVVEFAATGGDGAEYYLEISNLGGSYDSTSIFLEDSTYSIALFADTYNVLVRDNLGCPSLLQQFELVEPEDVLRLTEDTVLWPPCIYGDDGQIHVETGGGFRFDEGYWLKIKRKGEAEFRADSVLGTSALFLASAGDAGYDSQEYIVQVRDSNECTVDLEVIMPPNPDFLTLTLDENRPPSCDNGTNGEITVTATNFRPKSGDQLLFRISGGHFEAIMDTLVAINTADTTQCTFTFEDLHDTKHTAHGNYTIWVEDYYGCADTASQIITNIDLRAPDRLRLSTDTILAPSCLDGVNGWMVVRAQGGGAPYLFSFDSGAFTGANLDESTLLVRNLKSGDYTVHLHDANYVSTQPTCEVVDTFQVFDGFDMDFGLTEVDSVSCLGGSDGMITLGANFSYLNAAYVIDTSRFSVLWTDNGETAFNLTGLSGGTYNLRAEYDQDTIVCREYFDPYVAQPATAFGIDNLLVHAASCGNDDDGLVEVDFSGGWPKDIVYYSLDGGPWESVGLGTSNVINDLEVGEHSVRYAKSDFQCVDERSFEILSSRLQVTVESIRHPSCHDADDGEIVLTTLVDPVEFLIAGTSYSSSSGVYAGLPAGTYQLVVRDAVNTACVSDTLLVTLTAPDPLEVTLDLTHADCGQNNGTGMAEVSGGTVPYTLKWRFKDGRVADPSALLPGEYYVNVTDSLGCSVTDTFAIDNVPGIVIGDLESTPADCEYPNGTLAFTITGGVAPYFIDGEHAGTNASLLLEDLIAGEHEILVADNRGCQSLIEIEIPQQNTLNIALIERESTTCEESNGSIRVGATGGQAPYLFDWDGMIADSSFIDGLSVGAYNLTVSDQFGCEADTSFSVFASDGIRGASTSGTSSYCGQATGSLSVVDIDGDFPPYVIDLSGPGGVHTIGTFSAADSVVIPGLVAGTYEIRIYDDNGCLFPMGGITISDDPGMELVLETLISDSSACNLATGSLQVSPVNGEGPYSYNWYDENGTDLGIHSDVASGLLNGTYEVYVEDANGCGNTAIADLYDRHNPQLRLLSNSSSPEGASIGEVQVSASGGSGSPYTYHLWFNGLAQATNQSGIFSNLIPGIYRVVAEDQLGCNTDTISVPVDGTARLKIQMVSKLPATCPEISDGSAILSASGGISPYQFLVDGSSTTTSVTGLSAGEHTLKVIDNIGSVDTISIEILSLTTISVNATSEGVWCPGASTGSIDLVISGGSGNYQVSWEDDSSVEDNNRSDLDTGTYLYEISDARNSGCFFSGTVVVPQYEPLEVSIDRRKSPTCFGGADGFLRVIASGGSGSYEYVWETGEEDRQLDGESPGDYSITVSDTETACEVTRIFTLFDTPDIEVTDIVITPPSCVGSLDAGIKLIIANAPSPYVSWSNGMKTASISGIGVGTYAYTITSALGCGISGEVIVEDIPPLSVAVNKLDNRCHGLCQGEIEITVSGGVPPYFISWNSGPRTRRLSGLCNGSYSYVVEDANKCTVSGVVKITSPEPLSVSLTEHADASCFGASDGYLEVLASGGTGNYTYHWNTGDLSSRISDLGPGQYQVTISDSLNCQVTGTYGLLQPTRFFTINDVLTQPNCSGFEDGSITLNPAGGTPPYSYAWDTGDTTLTVKELGAGTYVASLTDANGCAFNKTFRLANPEEIQIINRVVTDPVCHDDSTGAFSFEVLGGSPPYSYSWDGDVVTVPVEDVYPGVHSITIIDDQGCSTALAVEFTNPSVPIISGIKDYDIMCDGGSIFLSPHGDWKSYNWTGPDGFSSHQKGIVVEEGGDYVLQVTDFNDCPASFATVIEASENPLSADFIRVSEEAVFEPLIFVDLSLPIPDSVQWILPDDPAIVVNEANDVYLEVVFTAPGIYEVGVRSYLNNCVAEQHKLITIIEVDEEETQAAGRRNDEEQVDVALYPNPVATVITLLVQAPEKDLVRLQLIDLQKNLVIEEEVEGKRDYLINWDVSDVMPGVYVLITQHKEQVKTKRVLIIR